MKTPKKTGILSLLFWICICHIPLAFAWVAEYFGDLQVQAAHDHNYLIEILGLIFVILSFTALIYTPAIILCNLILGPRPPEVGLDAFMSVQAFIMALSLWLFQKARARNSAKANESTG
jgi:hypothetical protein